jgi:hypothetical protein
MNFLKFNNMYFQKKYFFNCMIKKKIDNYIIVFNYKKKVPCQTHKSGQSELSC